MKVLVDYSTHCSTTRSSFSFDLMSCSVSLQGILLAAYKILYRTVLMSQARQRMTMHVQCVLQRTVIPYKILYSARRMPRKLTEHRKKQQMLPDIRRMSGDVFIFQQDSASANRARDTSSCYDMKPQTSLDQMSGQRIHHSPSATEVF